MSSTAAIMTMQANPRLLAAIRVALGVIALNRFVRLAVETWQIRAEVDAAHVLAVGAWLVFAIMLTVGWYGRLGAWGLVALWPAFLIIDYGFFYWNHHYLIVLVLFLVALSDCERHYALRPRGSGEVLGWPLFLMKCQLSIVYLWAAVAKINEQFLTGDVLGHYFPKGFVPLPLPESVKYSSEFLIPLSFIVVAVELFMAAAPWSQRLRPAAVAAVLPFHAGMLFATTHVLQFYAVALFGVLMCVLLAAFLKVPEGGRLVVWDDGCSFCRRWVGWFRRLDAFGALRFAGSSSPAAYDGTGVTPQAAARALQLVEPDGRVRSGWQAVQGIVAVLPAGYLFAPYMALPGARRAGEWAYHRVAASRACSYEAPALQTVLPTTAGPPDEAPPRGSVV